MLELLNSLAVSFDLPILDWIQANLQSPFMDFIMPIITLFGEAGIFWIAWAVLLLFFKKTRQCGWSMGAALMLGVVICNMILKPTVMRPRPYDFQLTEFGVIIDLLIDAQHDYSFPSGHTIACFEASVVLLLFDKRMGIPAFILGLLVSFSRLYLYVHYPTDVIASVILGTAFAFLGAFLVKKVYALIPQPKQAAGKYLKK